MKNQRFTFWLAALLSAGLLAAALDAALPLPVSAPGDSPQALTLERCIELGLTYSKSLYASQLGVQAAEARAAEAVTRLLPSLSFQGAYTRLSSVPPSEVEVNIPPLEPIKFVLSPTILNSGSLQLVLQQPLFTGFGLEAAARAARAAARSAKQSFVRDREALVIDITSAYWTLVQAREMAKLLDENVQTIQAHLEDVRRFVEQGLAKNNDLLKVQVQLATSKVGQLEAANGVRLAMMALNSLLGLPLDQEIDPVSRPEAAARREGAAPAEAAVAQALARRPEMKAIAETISAARSGVRAAQSSRFPKVFLVGNVVVANPNERIWPVQAEFRSTWDVSLAVSFDLWNWRASTYQVRQALAQLEQARAGEAQLRDGIALEVRKSQFDLQQALQKIDLAEEAVRQAEENYRVTHERFKAGLTPNSELLDAEMFLLQAKVSRTEAHIGHEMAVARLHRSLGSE